MIWIKIPYSRVEYNHKTIFLDLWLLNLKTHFFTFCGNVFFWLTVTLNYLFKKIYGGFLVRIFLIVQGVVTKLVKYIFMANTVNTLYIWSNTSNELILWDSQNQGKQVVTSQSASRTERVRLCLPCLLRIMYFDEGVNIKFCLNSIRFDLKAEMSR